MEKRTSILSLSLVWMGAGISLAEIITGAYFAPLGFLKGSIAIAAGHLAGFALLFGSFLASARARRCAMDCAKMSFGKTGGNFFALLNVAQLAGWTAIMIYDGGAAAEGIFGARAWVLRAAIGALIAAWILARLSSAGKANVVAMTALFALTVVLCRAILGARGSAGASAAGAALSFGQALELSIAMPLSWLPVAGDYTKDAERPLASSLAAAAAYCAASAWMYFIGMAAAIFTGESDVARIMDKAGLGAAALAVVVLSTVTTTFLDAFSAGVSLKSIFPKAGCRAAALAVCAAGTVCAIFLPMDDITDFLYLIGSVFAPMVAVTFSDAFALPVDSSEKKIDWAAAAAWLAGFAVYRVLLRSGSPVGATLPSMAAAFALRVVIGKIRRNAVDSRQQTADS